MGAIIVHRVDMKELRNRIAVNLGRLGFGAILIGKRTDLTEGQVRLRLKKAGVRITDYRHGTGEVAEMVIAGTEAMTRKRLEEMRLKLRRLLK